MNVLLTGLPSWPGHHTTSLAPAGSSFGTTDKHDAGSIEPSRFARTARPSC
jgi:hypothetical protein